MHRSLRLLLAGAVLAGTSLLIATPSDAALTGPTTARDARTAPAAVGLLAGVHPMASWYSGTLNPGSSQSWVWNNASPTAAFKVGLSPTGASTTTPCQFEVTRTWYAQLYSGEHKFYFVIQNIGGLACGSNVLLSSLTAATSWSTGGLDPGQSGSWTWYNANPLNASHLVGLSPSGATSSTACQLEVTRTWYGGQPSGERRFYVTVKNVGSIACSGTIELAWTTTSTSWSTGSLAAGATSGSTWNNANPLNLVYVPGLSPVGTGTAAGCQLEVVRSYYVQRINADGTSQRQFVLYFRNVGTVTCSGTVLLASVAA